MVKKVQMNSPKVSIIILNWNKPEVTGQCLDSLRKASYSNREIILVDNGSADNSVEFFERNYPEAALIRNSGNEGFARGCNIGIRSAAGEYFLLLNNDTEVAPDFLDKLVLAIESGPRIAAVGARILSYDPPHSVQYAGATIPDRFTGRTQSTLVSPQTDPGSVRETGAAHGAAMLISRKAAEDIGLLYEGYFAYYEEVDWCCRAKRKGYRVLVAGGSVVLHKGLDMAAIPWKMSPFQMNLMTRNRIIFMRRNFDLFSFAVFCAYFTAFVIPLKAAGMMLSGRWALLAPLLRGAAEGYLIKDVVKDCYLGDR